MPVSGAVQPLPEHLTVSAPAVWVALRVNPAGGVTAGAGLPHVATEATTTSPVAAPAGTATVAAAAQASFPVDELERYVGVPPPEPVTTLTVTVSLAVNWPSPTVSLKVSVDAVAGAVNVGLGRRELDRVTERPGGLGPLVGQRVTVGVAAPGPVQGHAGRHGHSLLGTRLGHRRLGPGGEHDVADGLHHRARCFTGTQPGEEVVDLLVDR